MKYLLLFLISFSIQAKDLYLKVEGDKVLYTTYDKSLCVDCLKINLNQAYDPEVYDQADEFIEDESKPIYEAKSEVVLCKDDCIEKEKLQVCPAGYLVIRTDNEVYCTKVLGYEKVPSGNKIPSLNQQKKAAKDAKKAEIDLLKQDVKDGKKLSEKQVSDLFKYLLNL